MRGILFQPSMLVLQTVAQSSSDTDPAATRVSLGNTLRARGNIIRDRQSSPKYDYLPWRCEVIEPESRKFPQEARDFHQQAQQQYSDAIALSNLGTTRISAQLNLLDLILETTPTNSKQTTLVNNLLSEIDFSNLSINKATIYAQINLAKSQACLAGRLHSSPDWQKIRQILIQAQQNAQSISNVHLESYALGNLGRLYEYRAWWLDNLSSEYFAEKHQELKQQQPSQICQTAQDCRQEAIKLTFTALLLAQPDATPQIAYQWQWQLGRLWATQGDRARAITFYEAATKTLESVRSDLINLDSDVQFSFRDDVEPLYRQLIDLLLTTDATSEADTQDFPTQALEIIDFLRLSELENFLQCSLGPELQVETVVGEIDPQAAFIYPLILSDRLEIIFKLPQQPLAHRATFIQHTEVEATVEKLQSYWDWQG